MDELEEQLAKQLAEVRAERDELAVAERVPERMSEQLADERASAATPGHVAGRAVMLIPHRTPDVEETQLPPDYQRILTAVRQAAGPVMAREVGEMLGVDVSVRAKLEPLRGKLVRLADRAGCANCPTAGSLPACEQRRSRLGAVQGGRNHGAPGGRWNCVTKTKERAETPARLSISAVCRCPRTPSTTSPIYCDAA
ncbi:hypothetical protein QF034_008213 [Streptomyces africanus]|uniref:Uncharacterized protein n=1 Tax=Streptomyces africanus TaxID=231024 RepID=A0ABU0R2U4_9ACTN|nr:hypothetical protein [Streptomyces africanus]MDQ0753982.1 hypothetical protein [Streptomyces africanus]